jgi:ADP-ribosylation factor-like protein 8
VLHGLLDEKGIENKPLLILSNKIDIEPHMKESEIIKEMNLDYVYSNPWAVITLSALKGTNMEQVVEWLSKKGK